MHTNKNSQFAKAVQYVDAGMSSKEACKKAGISTASFYKKRRETGSKNVRVNRVINKPSVVQWSPGTRTGSWLPQDNFGVLIIGSPTVLADFTRQYT